MGFHRHVAEILNLQQAVAKMEEYGPTWATKGPFKYCQICGCVPTTFTADDPPANTADRFAADVVPMKE